MISNIKNSLSLSFIIYFISHNFGLSASKDVPMISLNNTDFVVAKSFIIFVLILIFLKVPKKVGNLLDERAVSIKNEIDEANKILEDSKSVLAEMEREHKLNIQRAEKIIEESEDKAKKIILNAKQEAKELIEFKIKAAQEQIKSNENNLIKNITEKAINEAITKAEVEINLGKDKEHKDKLISESIDELGKLYK